MEDAGGDGGGEGTPMEDAGGDGGGEGAPMEDAGGDGGGVGEDGASRVLYFFKSLGGAALKFANGRGATATGANIVVVAGDNIAEMAS